MNIFVMGAGAIGCYYGGMLARAGHEVTLLGRAGLADIITREGLLLESSTFQGRIRVRATLTAEAATEAELVLFCVKSGETENAGRDLAPYLPRKAIVLSFQNGMDNADRLEPILNRPVLPAILYVAVEMAAPGHVRHKGGGEVVIGASDSSNALAALFITAGIPSRVSPDVISVLWDKLIINCAFNALSAIPHVRYGELVRQPGVLEVMHDVVEECRAVANAAGVRLGSNPHEAIPRIAKTMATQYSSTAQDLVAGKRSEIDHLNGYVVRRGQELGVPTPVNRVLQTLIHLIEDGSRPSPSHEK